MKTEFLTLAGKTNRELSSEIWPIDLSVIPNYMGINLCCVDGLSWTRQPDGQLVHLTIHFIPNPEGDPRFKGDVPLKL